MPPVSPGSARCEPGVEVRWPVSCQAGLAAQGELVRSEKKARATLQGHHQVSGLGHERARGEPSKGGSSVRGLGSPGGEGGGGGGRKGWGHLGLLVGAERVGPLSVLWNHEVVVA